MSTQPAHSDRIVLNERPKRGPITSSTFRRERKELGELKEGEVRVRVEHVSIRNWLNDARSYMPPVALGAVMRAAALGRVLVSRDARFAPGDLVTGTMGWQTVWQGLPSAKLDQAGIDGPAGLQRVSVPQGGREIDHLGLYGTSGMTAYFGMFDVGRLRDGDRVVVSGAAGSVGLIATQIALAHPKCEVTAIAGTPEKLAELRKMGVHHALNYKDKDFTRQLRKVGLVDVFFDNVGGTILDAVMGQLADKARIVYCGAIAAYNSDKPVPLYNSSALIAQKARLEGFIVFEYARRYPEGRAWLADQVSKGKIKYDYHLVQGQGQGKDGLDMCTGALEDVFAGRNYGKTIVRVQEPESRAKL